MSVRLYVGNLSKDIDRQEFEAVFTEDSEGIVSVKLIADRKTGKCRGFGFVTVRSDEIADTLVEKYNGYVLQDTALKVEKALPRNKGSEEEAETGNSRRSNNKKGRKSHNSGSTSASGEAAIQPDPRWAQELEKLKELLATQTTAS